MVKYESDVKYHAKQIKLIIVLVYDEAQRQVLWDIVGLVSLVI
jgi:hypothetical protein